MNQPILSSRSPILATLVSGVNANIARDLANRVRAGDIPHSPIAMDAAIARDKAIVRAEWSACVARVVANCIRLRG